MSASADPRGCGRFDDAESTSDFGIKKRCVVIGMRTTTLWPGKVSLDRVGMVSG